MQAIELDGSSVKGLYRKALALQRMGALLAAKSTAEQALLMTPGSQKLRHIQSECGAALREGFRAARTPEVTAAASRRWQSALERAEHERQEAQRHSYSIQRRRQSGEKWAQEWEAEVQRHDTRNWPRGTGVGGGGQQHQQWSGDGCNQPLPAARSPEDVLGVSSGASAEEIRRAYRRRVVATHPDKGGSADAFVELQEAVAALMQCL
mmetsp:Transcript_31970/g.90777  ORF Transcript_31970/g.90777 Transcript_31970/m.90777 type:complete len:208 (+) Transcript_31970:16-639(+)